MDWQARGATSALCDSGSCDHQFGVRDYPSGNVRSQLHLYCVEVERAPNFRNILFSFFSAVGDERAEVTQSSKRAAIAQEMDPGVFSLARAYRSYRMHHVLWCRGTLGTDDGVVQQTDRVNHV